ncbi:MAG TPA: hypothetical protein VJT08_22030 [Terriglobales bacterium]|nr:hypothetical protein [Terriglobales bacterium]
MQAAGPGIPPSGPVQVGVFSTGGIAFGIQGEAEIVRNQPYQAKAVTEIRQTLANGAHITQTITATVARDNEGRTLRSQQLQGNGPFFPIFSGDAASASPSAKTGIPTLTTIFDPVDRKHIDYTSDEKVARVLPIDISTAEPGGKKEQVSGRVATGMIKAFPLPGGPGPVIVAGGEAVPLPEVARRGDQDQTSKTEPLGTRVIEGIETTGTRRMWTLPAGAIGNDKPLVTTEETWYSPKLRLVLLSVREDPRFGETVYSLKDIQTTEPDKSLFQIPAGYAVEKLPVPPPPDNRTPR